jgi:hypothetical protein
MGVLNSILYIDVIQLFLLQGSVSCLLLDGNTLYSGSWDMTVLVRTITLVFM